MNPETNKAVPANHLPSKQINLRVSTPEEGHRVFADAIASPGVAALRVISASLSEADCNRVDSPSMLAALRDQAELVRVGDMANLEAMLTNQATALQTLSARLIELGMAQSALPQMEAMLRLGLKAQSQARTTVEAIAMLKNPPVVYAKQANIANGPQQVNNGVEGVSRMREIKNLRTKLLEARGGQRMDPRAQGKTG